MADVLAVTHSCVVPLAELTWKFTASGGPGGQHANKTATRAEVRFDIANSPSLGPRQKARLLDRLGPEIRVAVDEERSQSRNRALALERLRERLAEGLKVEAPRQATRPTLASKRRRLEAKKRRSDAKRLRGGPSIDDG